MASVITNNTEAHIEGASPLPDIDILVYDELGLAGLLLLIAVGWLSTLYFLTNRDLKTERKSHKETIDKLYALGTASVEQHTLVNATLDKIYNLLTIRPVKKTSGEE